MSNYWNNYKMIFIIIGKDGTDAEAPARRQSARPAHLAYGDELKAQGHLHYGVALCNDQEQMIGSVYVMEFPDRTSLDEYLKQEPYMTGDVWRDIEIHQGKIGLSFVNIK